MSVEGSPMQRSFAPDPNNTRALRDAFGHFATGVTIVTAASAEGPVAITANSFSSVSLTPPLVLWSPNRTARRFPYFEAAQNYAIHVLRADQHDLCWKIASDAFGLREFGLVTNDNGVPVLPDCLARFDCTRRAIYDGGDHAIVLGEVTRATIGTDGEALAFFKGKTRQFAQD
jgi:flavin reductase (DIM6/NTAB) family NADH-FMN oxidoreductase RutF